MQSPRFILAFVLCHAFFLYSCSQNSKLPFEDDIASFQKADKDSFPPANAILFVGSSSFTMWKDVANYFPGYTIINRGFGGSGLNDVIRYADKIIIPYKPKQIVIYCGENDVATGSATSTDVEQRFIQLFGMIRQELPDVAIAFISMKPSPSREKYIEATMDANKRIRAFLAGKSNTAYIDVFQLMLGADGKPRKELFREDMLHMKPEGYAIWQKAIEPALLK